MLWLFGRRIQVPYCCHFHISLIALMILIQLQNENKTILQLKKAILGCRCEDLALILHTAPVGH